MRHFLHSLVAATMLASMLPFTVSASSIEPQEGAGSNGLSSAPAAQKIPPSLQQAQGKVQVLVELNAAPTFQVRAESAARGFSQEAIASAQRKQLARIQSEQDTLTRALPSMGAQVIYTSQRIYNGIAVVVDSSKLSSLAGMGSVKAIHRLIPKQLDNAISVPEIGAPQLWDASGANVTGTGIRVGIIDTGIDYTHANFGGTKDYAANDGAVIESGSFPTAKVVGGTDLAGDDYNADPTSPSYQPVPHPDADPLDCSADNGGGHGSHVAGTAAGLGVTTAGNTYAGPYNSAIDFSTSTFKIGPGVAPGASLYGIRVFGCDGSTNLVVAALDYAIDPNGDGDTSDHLDVVNMSLGSNYAGFGDVETDPDAVASERAVSAGVVVVASAGNAYDTHYITGSPGSAASVISVASSVDAADIMDALYVTADSEALADTLQPASFSVAYAWDTAAGFTGDIVYPPTQRDGCAAFTTANKALLNGKVALLDWTDPSCGGSVTRTGNAVAAGAKAVILVDNSDVFDLSITGSSVAPSVSIPKATGDAIKAGLGVGNRITVTFDKTYRGKGQYGVAGQSNTLSDFSSMGPRRDGLLKPDIAAPGQGIFSTRSGSNTEGESLNGTSMAAPLVSGSMALLRQLHPDWSVQELKALAMSTATQDIDTDVAHTVHYGPTRVGAGRISLVNAAEDAVIVYNKELPNVVGLSFGTLDVTQTLTLQKQVTVQNKGASSVTYDLSYEAASSIPGVAYAVSPTQVTVAAGASVDVTVTFTADPSQMTHALSPSENETQVGSPRNWLSEAQGFLKLAPTSAVSSIRLPVYAAPRRTSVMKASQAVLPLTSPDVASQSLSLTLAGTGFNAGTGTDATTSLVSAFELAYTSPQATTGISKTWDIQHVGVTSTITSTALVDSSLLYFLVSGYDSWASPNVVDYEIFIDTDKDGSYDYVLYNDSIRQNTSRSDVFITTLYDRAIDDSNPMDFLNFKGGAVDTAPFNTNAMVFGVDAASLGLSNAKSSFAYWVTTYSTVTGQFIDTTPVLTYDVAKPAVRFSGGLDGTPLYADAADTTIPVDYVRESYLNNAAKGVILFHHHNARGQKLDVISGPQVNWLPIVSR